MKTGKETPFAPISLQKQGGYYKIPIPPDLIEEGLIDSKGIFKVILKKY